MDYSNKVDKNIVSYGDLVILYSSPQNILSLHVEEGGITNTKYGDYSHNDLVGKRWGTQVWGKKGTSTKGWMFLLRPSAELWTSVLHTRTQIVYSTDASIIAFNLHLKPGSILLEAGTGSGSLTHTFARSISPHGHVYTFEFNKVRAEMAAVEFKKNGLGSVITVEHRDVCEMGYPESLIGMADGLFLDLPSPWIAVPHAAKVLKEGGRICGFSPCIEQVQRTCDALSKNGFHEIKTIECLIKSYHPRKVPLEETLAFGNGEVVNNESESKSQDESKVVNKKRKFGDIIVKIDDEKEEEEEEEEKENNYDEVEDKEEEEDEENDGEKAGEEVEEEDGGDKEEAKDKKKASNNKGRKSLLENKNTWIASGPISSMRGHTSFLTFAVKKPAFLE